MALDLTLRMARQAKARSASSPADAGWPVLSTQPAGSSPGASISSGVCSSRPPSTCRHSGAWLPRTGGAQASRRRFLLPDKMSSAASSKPGAMTISVKMSLHLAGHRRGNHAVSRDDAAEGGLRIARVRLPVRLGQIGAERNAARVGVLDDGHARLDEVERGPPGCGGVDVVVVGHGLAVQLGRPGDARGRLPGPGRRPLRSSGRRRLGSRAADVQRGPLVRVLPVPECLTPGPQRRGHVRPAGLLRRLVRRVGGGEPGRHRTVVRGGVRVGAGGQPAPLLQAEPATGHRRRDVPVPGDGSVMTATCS